MTLAVQENVVLAPHTTLEVGGPARLWIEARSAAEILQALALAQQRSLPVLVLGGGSNDALRDRVLRVCFHGSR